MVKIKLEKNQKDEPVFKLNIKEEEIDNYRFLKRALLEGKAIKGRYNYEVPIRFFEPIFKNLKCEGVWKIYLLKGLKIQKILMIVNFCSL